MRILLKGEIEDMIKAILFDFGGVIAEEGFREGLKALARQQGLDESQIFQAGMDAVYESGWVKGRGSEHNFWQIMAQKTGLRGDPEVMREAILERFRIRPAMLALVDNLRRRGYLVGLLSDQTEWLDELDRRHGIYSHFDKLYISYRLGKGKRSSSLFQELTHDLDLLPEQILFIDDSPDNIQRAREFGWQGIVFTDEDTLSDQLRKLGVEVDTSMAP
ncbi:MAG TPA: HAD family phosphatase [Methylothermaceae bacterium]|nr:HAD family phosphatase [Methylothermaceae bacterium]